MFYFHPKVLQPADGAISNTFNVTPPVTVQGLKCNSRKYFLLKKLIDKWKPQTKNKSRIV